ncbi:MAG: putative Glycosyl transferase [Verrucomicrobia bacterium]|nr:putative Glycosyl transferase [Verrucomicrobiota bacterium]
MEAQGVRSVAGFRENLTPEWLRAHRDTFDVLHLHWPWALYNGATPEETTTRCATLIDALFLARSLGYKVVWTMHNLYPHDSTTRDLDHLARLAIAACATAVIVHCEHARGLLAEKFCRREDVFLAPHGHFCDAYPNVVSRREARAHFGFNEADFVYLFFGNVRANKGVEQLLESFLALPGENLRFLFAARICSDYGAQVVERARQADSRIVLRESKFYANEDFQWFFNAADVAVFPFTDILTSGSAVTALSFHCPVLVPAIGCLPELIDETVGAVYQPGSAGGLRRALDEARAIRRDALRPGIEQRLRELSWDGIARTTLEAYRA